MPDSLFTKAKGLVCRLLASASLSEDGGLSACVQPVLLPAASPEAAVRRNFNLAKYRAANAGDILLMGQGAGRYPTASAVLRDLSDLQSGRRAMFPAGLRKVSADGGAARCSYYVRLPSAAAGALPFARSELCGDVLRGVTEPISAAQMHGTAAKLRADGASVFFAALEG